MRKKRTPIMLALAGLIASLMTFVSSGTASAAESIPETQWSPKVVSGYEWRTTTGPQGTVTEGCVDNSTTGVGSKLRTYSATGSLVQEISSSQTINGVPVCISKPTIGKNGDVYGSAGGVVDGYWRNSPNLLAYKGNALKWKYPTGCEATHTATPAVGADGNVYFINSSGRLIGLTPEVQPPLTTPAKVLDVPVSGTSCGTEVRAFKDGVAVIDNSQWVHFYTYGGTYLSSRSANHDPAAINAAGRLFSPTWTGSGDNRGIQISAYDPITKKVTWTAQESSFGRAVDFYETYPTPDGGAVVYIKRTKVVSGAPTSERVHALVKLNAYGIKVWDQDLPNKDTSGVNTAGNNYMTVDTTGKLILVRDWTKQLTKSPWQVPFITIDTLSVATGNAAVATRVMSGNLDAASGNVNGYQVRYNGANGLITGAGTLYLHAACKVSCAVYDETKLYPIKVTGLGLDYPRGAVLTVPSPLKPYVALGDSFSSGQGAGVYDTDTVTSTNKCYKSYNGYGRILGRDTSSPLMLTNFAACGGSITDNIDTNTTYPGVTQKQDEVLSSDTKVVSLTIGGNDIGFGDVITTCADPMKDCDGAYSLAYNRLGVLANKLQRVYLDILQKAPNAKVYVLGYPPIVTTGPGCMVGNNGSDYPIFSESRKQKAVDLANSLNTAIQTNVNTIRQLSNYDQRLKFIDAAASGSPFIGHDVCSSDPYVNGLILPPGNSSESFHPNPKGMKAYADLLAANMN